MNHPPITTALVSEYVAKFSTAMFAGASLYRSYVEHPGRLQCGTRIAHTHWSRTFHRAMTLQMTSAGLGALGSAAAYYYGDRHPKWLIAGAIMFAMFPYTLVAIAETNSRLLDPNRDPESDETKQLLETWGCRDMVRTVASIIASLVTLHPY